jgi:membrane protease subunit (stomatin/prohibitin family)
MTPEQAIAATLGSSTLTAEQVREAIMSADRWRKPMGDTGMTNTHLIIRDDGWQAIADELNATVGAGTCRNKGFVDDGGWYFVCSECGCEFEYGDFACEFAEGHGLGSPKFCPNCGAMVVVE